jgi:membrane protease YdiL (CAAX protease family)
MEFPPTQPGSPESRPESQSEPQAEPQAESQAEPQAESQGEVQAEVQRAAPPLRLPFTERHGISPIVFAVVSLGIIFFTYQIIGGALTLLIFGAEPGAGNIAGYRLATALGELLLVLGPTLLLVRFATLSPRWFLRLNVPDVRTILVPIIGIFSLQEMLQIYLVVQEKIPLPEELQKIVRELSQLMEKLLNLLVGSNSVPELLWVVVVLALVPALVEELLFRGLIQRSFERHMGPVRAIVLTGILFGAFHLNPFNFVPLAALGMYLGFVAYRANSVWSSVSAHFFNNAIACVASYLHMDQDSVVVGDPERLSPGILLATFWFFGVIFLLTTFYLIRITAPRAGDHLEEEREPAE